MIDRFTFPGTAVVLHGHLFCLEGTVLPCNCGTGHCVVLADGEERHDVGWPCPELTPLAVHTAQVLRQGYCMYKAFRRVDYETDYVDSDYSRVEPRTK